MADDGSEPVIVNSPSNGMHLAIIANKLYRLFVEQRGVDFALHCGGGRTIFAHRFLAEEFLAPYVFHPGNQVPHVERGFDEVLSLLEFMYTGTVTVAERKLEDLLQLARELGFVMLVDAVEVVVSSRRVSGAVEEAAETQESRTQGEDSDTDAEIQRLYKRWTKQFEESNSEVEDNVEDIIPSSNAEASVTEIGGGGKVAATSSSNEEESGNIASRLRLSVPSRLSLASLRNPRFYRTSGFTNRSSHLIAKRFKCNKCSSIFSNKLVLTRHLIVVHGRAVVCHFTCERCNLRFKTRSALAQHELGHSPVQPFQCEQCKFRTCRKQSMGAHMKVVHNVSTKRFVCESCGKQYHSRGSLAQHQPCHASDKPLECPQCNYTSIRKQSLAAHLTVVHGVGTSRFVCEQCGKRFCSRSALARHNLSHTKEKPFMCEQCSYTCSQKATLKQHADAVHGPGRFRCDMCGKSVLSPSMLVSHMRTHTHEKPYECQHCSHRASGKHNLDNHVRIVHGLGSNKYTCETCGRPCASRFQLDQHMRTHTKERPFKCPHCAHASSQKVALKQHMYIVHGVGPVRLACDVCGKRCQSKADLARHRMTHASPTFPSHQ